MNIESITGKGRLNSLDGNEDAISGRKTINFYLTVDEFKDKNVEEVYLISELSSSNFTITNTLNGKSLSLLLRSTGSLIHIGGTHRFVAEISKSQLQYISHNLLARDLVINWNMEYLGFIGYKNNPNPALGKIVVSNTDWSDTKVSSYDFNNKVWSKISGEERYLISIPNVSSSLFLKVPSEVDDWGDMMKKRADVIVEALKKFEKAENSNDFATIARDLKSVYDKLDEVTKNNSDKLDGLLFNKLFSGPGVNEASKGFMEGIVKIMDGIEKVSNQIGHTATFDKPPKPFTFVGDRETVLTFLFVSALLFSFMEKML